jgi:hypothetical protein
MSFCGFVSQTPYTGECSEQLCLFQLEIQQQREMTENDRARRSMTKSKQSRVGLQFPNGDRATGSKRRTVLLCNTRYDKVQP